MSDIQVITMIAVSWPEVKRIYLAGIATGNATFETNSPEWETWDKSHRADCRLIAVNKQQVIGWTALSNVSSRCVYAGVAEVSIYVDESHRGLGIGNLLMKELIHESEKAGIWTLQAGIFPENQQSIRLHEKNGFRLVGQREKLGKINGQWRDVYLFERRSSITGIV